MIYFTLDKTLKKPLYKQIVEQVEMKIRTQEVNHFDMLPSEVQINQVYHVSSFVVKKAYKILEDQGLIQRIKGKGTFIYTRKTHMVDSANIDQMSIPLKQEYTYKVISTEYADGFIEFDKQHKYEKQDQVKLSKVLVSYQGLPVCYFDICLSPNQMFEANAWLNSKSLLRDILKDIYQGDIKNVTSINAASADKMISDVLDIAIYDPLVVARTTYFKEEQPVCCIITYYPGEYTVFFRSNHEKESKHQYSH